MKLNNIKSKISTLLVVFGLISLISCESYMRNPLVDNETGENIKLLIVDFNFVTTKLAVHLQDVVSNEYIVGEEVQIVFLGDDASNLITYTGTKPEKFLTAEGYTVVGWDPNYAVTPESPIELSVMAVSENYVSAPMAISYTTEGLKDIVIKMIHTGIKSGSAGGYDEPFDLKLNGALTTSAIDELGFTANISALPTGNAYDYLNLYNLLNSGQLVSENVSDPLVYSDYGTYYIDGGSSLVPPANPTKDVSLQSGSAIYSSVLRTGVDKCSSGLTLQVASSDGSAGSASFNYLVTFSDGTTKDGIVSGIFPFDILLDNIYYPSANPAVTVELFGDAQYDISAAVNLSTACGGTANFTATKKAGLETYKFIIRYSCANAAASAALSIGGEFRKVGSLGTWTRFQFSEGIAFLQLIPDEDYDFRVIIDSDAYDYQLPTNPDNLEQYLIDNQSEDFYTINTLTITETPGLVIIESDVELTGEVCDIIN